MNCHDWIQEGRRRLEAAGIEEALLDAQLLVAHSAGQDRSWVLAHPEAGITDTIDLLISRRERREPLSYILGWREFFGRKFFVEPGVLVPRQDSETLVEVALDGLGGKVLDVGTGTGCLAVTIKLERPNWMVAACDVSTASVRLARKNARNQGVNVLVTRSDLFEGFGDTKFGLIVCNPPYVKCGATLQPEIADWEPPEALFAGPDGLDIYCRISHEAKGYLMPWGRLVLEIGDGMAPSVTDLFQTSGWEVLSTHQDLTGTDRALTLRPVP